jgi:hypothetical protein
MRESGESIEARAKAAKTFYGKRYHDHGDVVVALKQAAKAANREPNGWVPACDDITCNTCRKQIGEKSPQTQEAADKKAAQKAKYG